MYIKFTLSFWSQQLTFLFFSIKIFLN